MSWHKWFIPHRDTHQKAHLISWHGILIYILIYIILQSAFSFIRYAKPGVLGTTSNIQTQRLIELTNAERAKHSLPPLSENSSLSTAAIAKAANMFEENYWAHFSPSGKDPWEFMLGAGYKFEYAGENLAKNFTSAEDMMAAWMASPSHRDNILNPRYKEIGFAVEDGVLEGTQTTLVVQMFGASPVSRLAIGVATSSRSTPTPQIAREQSVEPVVNVSGEEVPVPKNEFENPKPLAFIQPITQTRIQADPLINPTLVTKNYALGVIAIISTLLIADFMILRRRGVYRITSYHLAHLSVLGVVAAAVISFNQGSIL